MKKVIVIGENSYIGKSFEAYSNDRFGIKMVGSRDGKWETMDFAGFDSVLFCAGIAHMAQDSKVEALSFAVNCDLAVDAANKAKKEKVSQFIYLSSMSVYGGGETEIDGATTPNPGSVYGRSKLKAEQELQKLDDDSFRLCFVRPPMVYGKGCKGNFPKLVKLAKRTPIFPDYPNKRSMIYIDNLCEFLCGLIKNESSGIFLPQNSEYVNTVELVRYVANLANKRIITTRLCNPIIPLLLKHISIMGKLLGDLTYVRAGDENSYNVVAFEESIERSMSM